MTRVRSQDCCFVTHTHKNAGQFARQPHIRAPCTNSQAGLSHARVKLQTVHRIAVTFYTRVERTATLTERQNKKTRDGRERRRLLANTFVRASTFARSHPSPQAAPIFTCPGAPLNAPDPIPSAIEVGWNAVPPSKEEPVWPGGNGNASTDIHHNTAQVYMIIR